MQNMVGPGEVDEELQPEVAEECSKYGAVDKCLIYEVSVVIFVELKQEYMNKSMHLGVKFCHSKLTATYSQAGVRTGPA